MKMTTEEAVAYLRGCKSSQPGFDEAIRTVCDALEARAVPAEPVAYMFPDDLKRFEESETFAQAYSVSVGAPDRGSTVPLYAVPPAPETAGDARDAIPEGWLIKRLNDGAIQARAPDDRVEIGYRFAADSNTAQARMTYKLLAAILAKGDAT